MKKSKILVSLVAILMITLVIGNMYSLATENDTIKITANTDSNKNESANVASNNTANEAKTTNNAGDPVGAQNSSKNNTTNNTTTNNAVNNTNSSRYNSTNNTATTAGSSLPKAGTSSTTILLVLAFVASAIYAYKKVSDYNV